jgi:PRTRC genetic system protein A
MAKWSLTMMTMKMSEAILAEELPLPPIGEVMYQYVVAGNGLFIRAEDSRLRALVHVAPAQLHGLADLDPIAELRVERVPGVWLRSVLASARRRMPDEAMYQFHYSGERRTWRCSSPAQVATPTALDFADDGEAVIDLHSHNSMAAFFSETDDADEQGLRFYAVIGRIDTDTPEILVRVGVYGHHMDVPADMVFDDLGPFVDLLHVEAAYDRACRVCGCTDSHGCENGCFWVADDLCSNCGDVPEPTNRLMHLLQVGWA